MQIVQPSYQVKFSCLSRICQNGDIPVLATGSMDWSQCCLSLCTLTPTKLTREELWDFPWHSQKNEPRIQFLKSCVWVCIFLLAGEIYQPVTAKIKRLKKKNHQYGKIIYFIYMYEVELPVALYATELYIT